MTTERGIEACCGACGEKQRIYTPDLGRDYVATLAGLMDGTFPPWAQPVPETSPIGKCGKCGGRFKCVLFGYPDGS